MRLRKKLIFAIVLSIIVSMLLLATIVFAQLRQRSEMVLLHQMEALLDETQNKTMAFVENAIANARLFANSNNIDRYLTVEDESVRYALMQTDLLRLFNKYQELYPEYTKIQLILPDGMEDTQVALSPVTKSVYDMQRTPYFDLIERSLGGQMTATIYDPDTGGPALLVSIAIKHAEPETSGTKAPNSLAGYLVLTASLDTLNALVQRKGIGEGGYLVVINKQQKIVFHPDATMIGKDATQLIQARSLNQMHTNEHDAMDHMEKSRVGNEYVYVQGRALNSELTLLSVLPDTDFQPVVLSLGLTITLVGIFAVTATSFLLYVLLSKLVLVPVSQLRQLALHIGDGEATDMAGLNLQRSDEIGDLTRAFYSMNSKLIQSTQSLKNSYREIEVLAYIDSLTGLPNRRSFLDQVRAATSHWANENICKALLYIDVNEFKKVNDTLGHEAGDELLRVVAKRLELCIENFAFQQESASSSGAKAVAARVGGDEFVFLTHALDDSMDAGFVADEILQELQKPIKVAGHELTISVSIGISCFPDNGSEVGHLMQCADTAMYEAKRRIDDSYRFYSANLDDDKHERLELENDLRIAIKSEGLALYFQPQVATVSKQIVGLEALLRWNHHKYGFISPEKFVGMAEDMGMIGVLGTWVLDEACRQWACWREQGFEVPRVAVNVSQKQFGHGYLPDIVVSTLDKYDMPPQALELEITESCMMDVKSDVLHMLNVIRDSGVRISMDDFGTGYSSLGSLNSLPIDILKIDRSFVTGVKLGEPNEKIVSAIVSLAHNLGLEIVAEGVETLSDYKYLLDRECEICQGYWFSRPLTVEQVGEMLANEKQFLQGAA